MNWLGAVLLVVAGAAAGFEKTASVGRTINFLEEWISLIRHISTELQQRRCPLPEMLERHRSKKLPLLVWKAALQNGQTVLETVEPWLTNLEPDAGRVVFELCGILGRYDGETQVKACAYAIKQLEEQRQNLRRQLAEKGKLYHAVPLTLGLMAALALL